MRKIAAIWVVVFSAAFAAEAQYALKTVTNEDLAKFRDQRLAAEKEYRDNHERLGMPSPEELEMMRERVVNETERRLAGDLLADALSGRMDPEELLKKPQSLVLPEGRGDLQFAILGSVAGAVVANMTPARYARGWMVMGSP